MLWYLISPRKEFDWEDYVEGQHIRGAMHCRNGFSLKPAQFCQFFVLELCEGMNRHELMSIFARELISVEYWRVDVR